MISSILNLFKSNAFYFSFTKTVNQRAPTGKLTIIPTPIGNMYDLTPNIVKALFTADLIGCEDQRIAGLLYNLIKNKNIIGQMTERFGTLGLSNLVESNVNPNDPQYEQKQHQYYNYSNMNEKERRKFLRRMTEEEQKTFKIQYLKYRALKILNKQNQFLYKKQQNKYDQLYGIDLTDLQHIESQIKNTRIKKNRGVLIPLNTYSETKMFDFVKALLQTKNVAIVSDAGMPCISDPGWKLVDKIRQTMPDVPIEVIGGPSSVGVMTIFASICSKNGHRLSGRFEGFAGLTTGNFEQNNREIRNYKMNEFSINFINAKKLRKRLLFLQKAFSEDHNILLANELTKRYERRYNGKIKDLINIFANDQKFEPIGEVSYLIYPHSTDEINLSDQLVTNQKVKIQKKQEDIQIYKNVTISMSSLLQSLQKNKVNLSLPQKTNLLCAVFGIKHGQARKKVYNNQTKAK